jgi:hypothetical protein
MLLDAIGEAHGMAHTFSHTFISVSTLWGSVLSSTSICIVHLSASFHFEPWPIPSKV